MSVSVAGLTRCLRTHRNEDAGLRAHRPVCTDQRVFQASKEGAHGCVPEHRRGAFRLQCSAGFSTLQISPPPLHRKFSRPGQ